MKKINLSRKSKLFIGGIGSLAVLATIPAAVVACGSTDTSQNTTTANISTAYSQIQNSYDLTTNNAVTKYDFSLINQGNIANVLSKAAILPSLPSGLSYKYTASTNPATAGAVLFTFYVQIVSGPYSQSKSPVKQVTVNLPTGTTGVTAVALTTTTATDFTKLVSDSINNQSFAANVLGQSTIAATTDTTPALASDITVTNLLTFTNLMPLINYTGITVTASALALGTNNTSVTATLTFTGTNVPANTTAKITITGFMPVTPSQSEINQVQENLNNYIQNLVLTLPNNGFNITHSIAQAPNQIVSSNVKATSSQYALLFADLLPSTTTGAATISAGFSLPANIVGSNVMAIVANNTTASSDSFTVTLQITVGTITASIPGITVPVIANTINPAATTANAKS